MSRPQAAGLAPGAQPLYDLIIGPARQPDASYLPRFHDPDLLPGAAARH